MHHCAAITIHNGGKSQNRTLGVEYNKNRKNCECCPVRENDNDIYNKYINNDKDNEDKGAICIYQALLVNLTYPRHK